MKTKKTLKTIATLAMTLGMLVGCGEAKVIEYDGTETQGVEVKDGVTHIKIGNSAAESGESASIGVPFNWGIQQTLAQYEIAHPTIKFDWTHYDDEFNASKGQNYLEKLVETDKIFAVVGHFGSPVVEATTEYIVKQGIPMVYAACGVTSLYNEAAKGHQRALIPVQPIFQTEGKSLLATAVAPKANGGLDGKNIGVIYTTDDTGKPMYDSIKAEAKKLGVKISAQAVDAGSTDPSSAVNALKNKKCDTVIVCSLQSGFTSIVTQMVKSNFENVNILTAYISSNTSTMGSVTSIGAATENRHLYSTAWLDIMTPVDTWQLIPSIGADGNVEYNEDGSVKMVYNILTQFTSDYWNFFYLVNNVDVLAHRELGPTAGLPYGANSYAMAGYLAADIFLQGIDRIVEKGVDFTWKNYLDLMEEKPVDLKMSKGGTIDLADGKRLGVTRLALCEYTRNIDAKTGKDAENEKGEPQATSQTIRGLTGIDELEKACGVGQ